jgi:hypothetical protein
MGSCFYKARESFMNLAIMIQNCTYKLFVGKSAHLLTKKRGRRFSSERIFETELLLNDIEDSPAGINLEKTLFV